MKNSTSFPLHRKGRNTAIYKKENHGNSHTQKFMHTERNHSCNPKPIPRVSFAQKQKMGEKFYNKNGNIIFVSPGKGKARSRDPKTTGTITPLLSSNLST